MIRLVWFVSCIGFLGFGGWYVWFDFFAGGVCFWFCEVFGLLLIGVVVGGCYFVVFC